MTMKLHGQMPSPSRPGSILAPDIIGLSNKCRQINNRRAELDHEYISLPERDPRREEICAVLVDLAEALVVAVHRLALAEAVDAGDLRQKAAVLAVLLQTGIDASQPEVSALALSVAEDVARVI